MPLDWRFVTPSNNFTIFYLMSLGGSTRYNFMNLWVEQEIEKWFPILQSWPPELCRIEKKSAPVEYTLRAYAQVPGTSDVTPLNIDPQAVETPTPGDQEWVLHLLGTEGITIQVGLVITPNEPHYGKPKGEWNGDVFEIDPYRRH
jgi:hypothetical protein